MKQKFKIFLAQLNPTGGDIEGNYKILIAARERALKEKVDIILAPEMFLSGYPIDDLVLTANSQDFGYCLGVLHHIPDTLSGLKDCSKLLKPGAPFLLYLYYKFDNKPRWFRLIY